MSDTQTIIDSVMSEAATPEPKTPNVGDTDAQQPEVDTPEPVEDEEVQDEADAGEEGDIPAKVKKALDKKSRYARNLKERLRAAERLIEEMKSQKYEPKQIDAETFDGSYGELIKQQAIEEAMARLSQTQNDTQIKHLTAQQEAIRQEQAQSLATDAAEYGKQSEDFAKTMRETHQKFDALPPQIEQLFYDLDEPILAAYALAKEGRIEKLAYMNPYVAAAEIFAAQDRGAKYMQQGSKPRPASTNGKTAPAPMVGVRGASSKTSQNSEDAAVDKILKNIGY